MAAIVREGLPEAFGVIKEEEIAVRVAIECVRATGAEWAGR